MTYSAGRQSCLVDCLAFVYVGCAAGQRGGLMKMSTASYTVDNITAGPRPFSVQFLKMTAQ